MTKRTSQEAYALRLAADVFINKKLILTNAIMPALRVKKEASVIVAAHRMSFWTGRVMQEEQSIQRAVTRLCIQCGLFLLQHGAESALVDELSTRLGLALGMDSVESAISSNAIVLTTIKDGQCLTSTRKNQDRGINMHVVTEVQHIVILAEHRLLDYKGVEKRFSQLRPLRYPRWLVAFMVGLSCSCFCKLNNGGWDGAVITFFASMIAMYIRQMLAQRHLHPQINFCITAFVATTISGLMLTLPAFSQTPTIAMAASVLLLVPAFR